MEYGFPRGGITGVCTLTPGCAFKVLVTNFKRLECLLPCQCSHNSPANLTQNQDI